MQNLVAFFVKNKQTVIRLFQLCYLLAIGFLVYAAQIMATPGYSYELVDVAKLAGTFAVIFFTLTVLPGIARRFEIRNGFFTILMLFRRHLGIMTFVFAMIHWCLEGVFPTVFAKQEPLQATFIVFGFIAFILMAILFFTSNDWSVRMLGKWWGRLHSLVYIIAWLIFCHLILLGMSFQMVIIGLLAILETASLIFSFLKKRLQPAVAQTDR